MDFAQLMKQLAELNGNVEGFLSRLTVIEEARAEWERGQAEYRATMEALEAQVKALDHQKTERKWAFLPGLEDEKWHGRNFSLFRAIQAIASKDWRHAEFEAAVFAETARRRDMAAGDDAKGGYLVPVQAIPELIEMLRAEAVCFAMGATLLDNLVGSPVEIPKQTGGATAYWVAEGDPITSSDLGTGQLSFTPKEVGALVKMSNRLLRMSNPSAETMVRTDLARVLALAVDLAALRGTGTTQPLGIVNTPGINSVAWGSAEPSFDMFLDAEYELAIDNALRGKLGTVFHPVIKKKLSKLKIPQFSGDTAGAYHVAPATVEQLMAYIGYPFAVTTQIPITLGAGNDTEAIFANWVELIVAQWAGLQILPSQEAGDAFAKNQTWIRIIMEVDVGLRHEESFCLISAIKAN